MNSERSVVRWPLWIKLLAGFVLVALVAVGTVAFLANRTTSRQFEIYVSQGRQARIEPLAPAVAAYYALHGDWAAVEPWLEELIATGISGPGQGRRQGTGSQIDRLVLADAQGEIVADTAGELVGERLSPTDLALGTPLEVHGQQVGTLLAPAAAGLHDTLEAQFLAQVNRSLVWAALLAALVASVLGLWLARQLTAPLRSLTAATHSLARGGEVQVDIHSRDEIGELAQEFNQMARLLAEQKTLRRNLLADITHELRTPLTILRSDLEAMLDGVSEPTPEALASLQEETLLLSRLVDDLRALAQAEAGQLVLERQPTDMADLLRAVVSSFDLQAQSQGQALAVDIQADLPLVDADPQRIRQVVANLVSNALRHASSAGQVLVSARREDGVVRICVHDDGPGIASQDLPHVFDRFWRGHQSRAGGSGLGLAIARQLVRAHGGRIWVESTPGQGATFCFTLPE